MTTIANLVTLQHAIDLKIRLGGAGIEAFIPDEVSAGVAPHFFMTKTGIRLQVADEDAEEARRIVKESFREEAEGSAGEEE